MTHVTVCSDISDGAEPRPIPMMCDIGAEHNARTYGSAALVFQYLKTRKCDVDQFVRGMACCSCSSLRDETNDSTTLDRDGSAATSPRIGIERCTTASCPCAGSYTSDGRLKSFELPVAECHSLCSCAEMEDGVARVDNDYDAESAREYAGEGDPGVNGKPMDEHVVAGTVDTSARILIERNAIGRAGIEREGTASELGVVATARIGSSSRAVCGNRVVGSGITLPLRVRAGCYLRYTRV